jgi:hypothetical protein
MAVSVDGLSSRARDIHQRVKAFIQEKILPYEHDVLQKQDDVGYIMTKLKTLQVSVAIETRRRQLQNSKDYRFV